MIEKYQPFSRVLVPANTVAAAFIILLLVFNVAEGKIEEENDVDCGYCFVKANVLAAPKTWKKDYEEQRNQIKTLMDKIQTLEAKDDELQKQVAELSKDRNFLTNVSEKHLIIDHATSGAVWSNFVEQYGPQLLFDDILETDTLKHGCFFSEWRVGEESWVALHLKENHFIKKVKILSRSDDRNYKRLTAAKVEVCNREALTDCQKLGTVGTAPKVGWVVVESPNENGIEGNAVRISLDSDHLYICEVRIFEN